MERETKTIETPKGKHKVLVHTYLTGRESEKVQAPLLQAMAIQPQGIGMSDMKMGKLDVSKIQESTHKLIESMVLEVDGKKDKILDTVLDMHSDDTDFIVAELNNLIKKN